MNKYKNKLAKLLSMEGELVSNIAGYFIEEYDLLSEYEGQGTKLIVFNTLTCLISLLACQLQNNEELQRDMQKIARLNELINMLEEEKSSL